jgi:hypothetical protein
LELDQLPFAGAVLNRGEVRAIQQRLLGDRRKLSEIERDTEYVALIVAIERPRPETENGFS